MRMLKAGVCVLAALACARAGEIYIAAVGIEDYAGPFERVPFAAADAARFRELLARVPAANVILLPGERARSVQVRNAIERTLSRAGPQDTACIFLSARGVTELNTHRGYVLTSDTSDRAYRGRTLGVDDLDRLIEANRLTRRIYLFADVCRQEQKKPAPNEIHLRLQELGRAQRQVFGILSCRLGERSGVDTEARFGVFTSSLGDVPPSVWADLDGNFDRLTGIVAGEVAKRSRGAQNAVRVTPLRISGLGPRFRTIPALLASLVPAPPYLWAQQADRDTEVLRGRFLNALREGRLAGPGGAAALFDSYRGSVTNELAAADLYALETALEDRAFRVIAVYGTGEQFPNDPARLQRSDFDEAAVLFDMAAGLRPGRADLRSRTLFCRGRAALFARDWTGAETDFQAAIRESSAYPEPYNGLGIAHLERQNRQAAVTAFQDAIDRAPEWAYPRHNLALTYTDLGDYRRAERTYIEAIRQAPHHPYLDYNLGLLYQRQRRLGEAERQYRAAAGKFGTRLDSAIRRAAALAAALSAEAANLEPVERSLRENALRQANASVVALKENLAEAYNALGTVRDDRRDRVGAIRYYRRALAQHPGLLEAGYNLGMDLAARREYAAAITAWRQNLATDPLHVPSWLGLARCYRELGQTPEAIASFRTVLALKPDDAVARAELARMTAR